MVEETIASGSVEAALKNKAKEITEQDVERVLEREAEVHRKINGVPGKFTRMVNQLKLLLKLIGDYRAGTYRTVPWGSIATAVAALFYFLSPVDLIPDVIPVVGFVDDAMVIALAVAFIQEDLKAFCAFKGYDPGDYFA